MGNTSSSKTMSKNAKALNRLSTKLSGPSFPEPLPPPPYHPADYVASTQPLVPPPSASPQADVTELSDRIYDPVGLTEDVLEILKKFDTVLIVDDSGSMRGRRWAEAESALASLAEVAAKYDSDGVEMHFLNSKTYRHNLNSSEEVRKLFKQVQPGGQTFIGMKLEKLLLRYLAKIEKANNAENSENEMEKIKPINYIVITDGRPSDDPVSVIVQAAQRLDRGNFPLSQVGIQFVQIGDDHTATEYLQSLDDDLTKNYKIRDIVDTEPYRNKALTAETLIKILLGGINRRVDKSGGSSVM